MNKFDAFYWGLFIVGLILWFRYANDPSAQNARLYAGVLVIFALVFLWSAYLIWPKYE